MLAVRWKDPFQLNPYPYLGEELYKPTLLFVPEFSWQDKAYKAK